MGLRREPLRRAIHVRLNSDFTSNLAVFIHNALLPSSAGKIILNGATQSVVGKGRDEQRVSFSNLLDDIGGQELQSSGVCIYAMVRVYAMNNFYWCLAVRVLSLIHI